MACPPAEAQISGCRTQRPVDPAGMGFVRNDLFRGGDCVHVETGGSSERCGEDGIDPGRRFGGEEQGNAQPRFLDRDLLEGFRLKLRADALDGGDAAIANGAGKGLGFRPVLGIGRLDYGKLARLFLDRHVGEQVGYHAFAIAVGQRMDHARASARLPVRGSRAGIGRERERFAICPSAGTGWMRGTGPRERFAENSGGWW